MKIKDNVKVAIACTVMPFALSWMLYRHGQIRIASVLFVTLITVAFLSLIIPKFGNFIHKTASKFGKTAGEFISRVILFFVYIFAVMPTGLIMKTVKRDRLGLKKKNVETYWKDCKKEQTDYEYQF